MKTYRYRLVVKNGLYVGKVVTRSNSYLIIHKKWRNENFDRDGRRYANHRSEIEFHWSDDSWHEYGEDDFEYFFGKR